MKRFLLLTLSFGTAVAFHSIAHAQATPLDAARAALRTKDPAKAAALLEPLTGAEAKDAAAFSLLSQVRLAQRKTAEAVVAAEKATVLDPTKAEYFSQLGIALGQRLGELPFMQQPVTAAKLKKAFAKAVELDPNDLTGLIGLARFYSNAPEIAGGSVEKAKEFAARVQRLDAFLGEIELGNIASHVDQPGEALVHYDAALQLKPAQPNALCSSGQMLVRLGKKDEARRRFEAALQADPAFEAAKKGLAELAVPVP